MANDLIFVRPSAVSHGAASRALDEEMNRQLRAQRRGEHPEARLAERLQQHGSLCVSARSREPLGFELGQDQALDALVSLGALDFDEEAGAAAQRVDGFSERWNPCAAELCVEPRARIEPFDLREREVLEHPSARGRRAIAGLSEAIREYFLHVGRALERVVVQARRSDGLWSAADRTRRTWRPGLRRAKAGTVFSGAYADAPRWATTQRFWAAGAWGSAAATAIATRHTAATDRVTKPIVMFTSSILCAAAV